MNSIALKITIPIALLANLITNVYSQNNNEITSLYFSNPSTSDTTYQFPSNIVGEYHPEKDTLTKLVITPDSIYLRYFYVNLFSKKDIRKSKKVYLKDDLLFGIKKGQGLPYEVHNDTIYTVLIQKETIYKNGNGMSFEQLDKKTYLLNYQIDKNHYYTEILKLSNEGVTISSLEHEAILPEILKLNPKEEVYKGIKTYILTANQSTINQLIQLGGFSDAIPYFKF